MIATTNAAGPIGLLALTEKQAAFRRLTAGIRGFVAGRGAGKTKIGAVDGILSAKNGDRLMCVSPNYMVMVETTYHVFKETCIQLNCLRNWVMSPVPRIDFATLDGGKADIVFRSGDNPDSLVGATKSWLWIDEASIQSRNVFNAAIPVLRQKRKMGPLIMTFTPKGKRHWTFEVFYEVLADLTTIPKDGAQLIQAHSLENPFLPGDFVHRIESQFSTQLAQQELAGQFVELIGLQFMCDRIQFADHPPGGARRVRYWDKACTPSGGSYTAGVLMSRTDDGIYTIEDVVRGQWSSGQREAIILQTAKQDAAMWDNGVHIHFEQEPGSGGKESAQQTVKMLAGFPVWSEVVGAGKEFRIKDKQRLPGDAKQRRATPFAAQMEHGNVRVLSGRAWYHNLMDELRAFPESAYSDQVDACSGAFRKLAKLAKIDSPLPEMTSHPPTQLERHGIQLVRARDNGGRTRGQR